MDKKEIFQVLETKSDKFFELNDRIWAGKASHRFFGRIRCYAAALGLTLTTALQKAAAALYL